MTRIFPVVDIFRSIQGEGGLAGVPSVFVRLAGCPIRCPWCDTQYAWTAKEHPQYTVRQIVDQVHALDDAHVVLTGGEPLIHRYAGDLIDALSPAGRHVTVETAGVVYRKFTCQLVSISPKLPGALNRRSCTETFKPRVIRRLVDQGKQAQIKFVAGKHAHVVEILRACERLTFLDRAQMMLMPLARTRSVYLRTAPKVARWALKYGFRFSPRLQLTLNLP